MRAVLALCLALAAASPAAAQDREQTLADIRQQLSVLYVEIQNLRTQLSTTGAPDTQIGGQSALERLNAIEAEVQRLTAKTEELEYRINRITTDGTNRIGDLEFRLCELEADCDIASLGQTPSLGGVDSAAQVPTPEPAPEQGAPQLAVGEQSDFQRASEALAQGDYRGAAEQFAAFLQTYPGGALTAEAQFKRGQALEGAGELSDAARAYLEAFSTDTDGPFAPRSLVALGQSLAALGQVQDACVTLGEVAVRFPASDAVTEAQTARRGLNCQ